jgi:hypothetical protein
MAGSRVVVVVPRLETGLHDYLRKSLACLKDVEVVLDRRASVTTPSDERRRRSPESDERKLLICSLVHCPAPAPPARADTPPAVEVNGHDSNGSEAHGAKRTLLWPALRLEDL